MRAKLARTCHTLEPDDKEWVKTVATTASQHGASLSQAGCRHAGALALSPHQRWKGDKELSSLGRPSAADLRSQDNQACSAPFARAWLLPTLGRAVPSPRRADTSVVSVANCAPRNDINPSPSGDLQPGTPASGNVVRWWPSESSWRPHRQVREERSRGSLHFTPHVTFLMTFLELLGIV